MSIEAERITLSVVRNDGGITIIAGTYPGSAVKLPACACVAQAVYTATRGNIARARAADVTVTDHRGNVIPREAWPSCNVRRDHWTWQYHGFTHAATDRP